MSKLALARAIVAALATPVFAQAVIETPTSTGVVVPPGAPGVVTRQPGSTGDAPAATDAATAGNEGQPSRVASTGSGGGR